MLSRYPDQARSRIGYALTGLLFVIFGVFMALIDSAAGATIGFTLGGILLIPSLLFNYSRFKKFEKAISWMASFGNL